MASEKIPVTTQLNTEVYQQLQEYMSEQKLSQTSALKAIVENFFRDRPQDELMVRINRLEQEIADMKRHVLAIRFRS